MVSKHFILRASTALCLSSLLTSLPSFAAAELTPQDVWSNTKQFYERFGATISADIQAQGDKTNVQNIVLSYELPQDTGAFQVSIPDTEYTQNADGTVSILYPEQSTLTLSAQGDDETFEASLDLKLENMASIASGNPEHIQYKTSYDTLNMQLGELKSTVIDDHNMDFDINADFTVKGYEGAYDIEAGDLVKVTYNETIKSQLVTYSVAENDDAQPLTSGTEASGEAKTHLKMALPEQGIDIFALTKQLQAGLSLQASMELVNTASTSQTLINGDVTDSNSSSTELTESSISFDKTGFGVSGRLSNIIASFLLEELGGLQVGGAMKSGSGSLHIPLLADEAPQDFAVNFALNEMKVDDMLWNTFDSENILPRDPASFEIALSGSLINDVNFLDFDTLEESFSADVFPLHLENLAVTTLIKAIGLDAEGVANMTFDYDDLDTFDGFPRPIGASKLVASGVNATLERLSKLGLLSDEDLISARFGLAFAAKSTGDDSIEIDLESTEDGHVLLNGQRIQ